MQSVKRIVIVVLLLVVQVVFSVSGFAQPNTEPRAQRSSLTVVRPYVPVRHVRTDAELPANLVVSPLYRSVVDGMLQSSPTFRRQCLRISSSPFLTVVIHGDAPSSSSRARAWTRIARDEGRLTAEIRIGQPDSAAELIAHEIEHIIEQLDGVDLAAKAAMRTTGVRQCDCGERGVFETERAVHVGLLVARELGGRGR